MAYIVSEYPDMHIWQKHTTIFTTNFPNTAT